MTIRNADKKSIIEMAQEMQAKVDKIRQRKDESFTRMKGMMGILPGFLSTMVLKTRIVGYS